MWKGVFWKVKKMMTSTNKIILIFGINLCMLGVIFSIYTIWSIYLAVIGGFFIFLALILQDKYKGSKP
jgi:uncharacterized membrane protein